MLDQRILCAKLQRFLKGLGQIMPKSMCKPHYGNQDFPHWAMGFTLNHELLPLDSNVRAKLTIMLKIKKFSKSFLSYIGKIK